MTRRGWALFVAMGVIWGLPYLLIRVSVREVSPAFLVLVRTAGGALLLSPFVVRRGMLAPFLSHWKPLVAYTIAELGVPWWVLVHGGEESHQFAGRAPGRRRPDRRSGDCPGDGLGPPRPAPDGRPGPRPVRRRRPGRLRRRESDLLAACSFVLVVAGYALGHVILSRRFSEVPGPSVVIASLVLCAVALRPRGHNPAPDRQAFGVGCTSMAGLAAICTAVAFIAFFALIAEVGPMRATVITYINPAIAVVLGVPS